MKGLIRFFGSRWGVVLAGCLIGFLSTVLQKLGNPPGAGLCIACFERDIAGALGFHRAEGGQYLRPEIIGLLLGSTLSALIFREFKARSGSAPIIRFMLGVVAMIGTLSFMGCPFGMILRLAGGNLNSILALAGLMAGIYIGVQFIKSGFDLGRPHETRSINGWVMPVVMLGLFLIQVFEVRVNDMYAPFHSWIEPSSLFAPPLIALFAGSVIGFLAQRTRFCTIGAFRDIILMRNGYYLWGVAAMLLAALAGNLLFEQIKISIINWRTELSVTPDHLLWSILGAVLAGLAFTLVGGCAGRQLFLSGEGDGDAVVFVLGMFCGAALTYNFSLFGRPACGTVGDFTSLGGAVIVLGLVFCLIAGFAMRQRWGN